MLITFNCNNCESKLEIEADRIGTRVECPACKASVVVPRKGLEPGTTVGGFRIVRAIGRGGMGEVYLARQISMDRQVALKILPSSLAAKRELADRFIQEVRLMARLEHPNLVTAFEAGEDGGVLYLAMAFINGPTLHDRVAKDGALAEREALVIVRKLAGALAYAWDDHRLLHRDIKPSNVLLDPKGEPRLADLGLARTLGRAERLEPGGDVVGTPNYMSPEQAAGGDALDFRADMYSLGATFYTMVTGRIPHEGKTPEAILRQSGLEPLPDPRAFNPVLSAACVALMGGMLARDPQGRYGSWKALIEDIDRVLAAQPPRGPASAPLPPPAAPPPPSAAADAGEEDNFPIRVLPIALAGLLIAVFLAVAGAWVWVHRTRPTAPPPPVLEKLTPRTPPATAPRTDVKPPPPSGGTPARTETKAPVPARPPPVGEAGRLMHQLRQYALDHPEDAEGIRHRVEAVRAAVPPDSPLAKRAAELLPQSGVKREQALGAASLRLRAETEQSIAAGDFDGALKKLANYPGPLAGETAELRQELADHVRQARDAKNIGSARKAFDALLDGAARDLAGGDAAAAQKRLRAAQSARKWDVLQPDLELALQQTAQLAEINQRLSETFRADKDHEIAVEFKNGKTETLLIVSGSAQGIRARRHFPQGYAERNFVLGELSVRERLKRIGNDAAPVPCLMRGLIARDGGDRTTAAKEFQQANCALGNALLRLK